jgi:hypothetical protein
VLCSYQLPGNMRLEEEAHIAAKLEEVRKKVLRRSQLRFQETKQHRSFPNQKDWPSSTVRQARLQKQPECWPFRFTPRIPWILPRIQVMLQLSFLHPADATGGDMKPVFHGQSGAWQATLSPRLRPGIMRGVGKPVVQMAGPAFVAARGARFP